MASSEPEVMTADSVRALLENAGAEVMVRTGRTEHYSAPREFSFEVRGNFPNRMGLHVVARQFVYRDPWEASGRVNDLVDVSLTRNDSYSALPKGFAFFQGTDEETGVDLGMLREIVDCVRSVNPKIYLLQEMTGDL